MRREERGIVTILFVLALLTILVWFSAACVQYQQIKVDMPQPRPDTAQVAQPDTLPPDSVATGRRFLPDSFDGHHIILLLVSATLGGWHLIR